MESPKTKVALIALAIVHIILSVLYASETPYRTAGLIMHAPAADVGAPDERAHANYIQELLDGKGVPHLDVDKMQADPTYRAENYEDHQPPAYYFLAAGWAKVLGVSDVQDQSSGSKLRLLNGLVGAVTVVGVFFAAYWGFNRFDLAITAAAFAALLPMNIGLSSAISNDPLLFAICSWVLAFCAKAIKTGWSMNLALLVGGLSGLAILTKTTGLALVPVLIAAILLPQLKRPTGVQIAVTAAAFIILAGPWWVRNQKVYGEPFALKVFSRAFSDTAQKSQIVALSDAANGGAGGEFHYWTDWVGWWTARSFIGTFGYMDVWMNETGSPYSGAGKPNTVYRLVIASLALLTFGWGLSLKEPWAKASRSVTRLNGLFLFLVVALFIKFDMQYFQAQGRYLYPAIAPICIGFASGLLYFAKDKWKVVFAVTVVLLLGLDLDGYHAIRTQFPTRTSSIVTTGDIQPSNHE